MKTLLTAGALAAALSLTVLSQQRAAAWGCGQGGFEVSANVGVSLGLHWKTDCGGNHCGDSCCYPATGGYGPAPVAYQVPAYAYQAGQYPAPQFAAPQPAPTGPVLPPPAPKKESKETAAIQNVGYSYPAGYDYNYAYWYGYPSYQGAGYYYGYGR